MSDSFQAFKHTRPSQSAAEAMDKNGVLYYGSIEEIAIGCWNSQKYPEFGPNNIHRLIVNKETLQFPSGLKASGI